MSKYDYEICLYNWLHRVPRGTLEEHYENCEFKPKTSVDMFNEQANEQAWDSGPWNSFLYDRRYPPDYFPDY
jgi:hypothetical protein